MANGKIRFGKQSGGQLALVIPDGVANTEVIVPESGILATEQYVNNKYSGFKNYIINGGFDIWQRGTSQTTSGYGSDDRWTNRNIGSTKTHSRVACTDTERALFNANYFSRTVVTSVASSSNVVDKYQKIENLSKFSGKTVTVSFWARADSNKNIAIEFWSNYGTGGSPSPSELGYYVEKISLTNIWKKYSITCTAPSSIGKTYGSDNNSYLAINFWFDAGSDYNSRTYSLGQQSGTFDIAQVQLEEGSIATPFENRPYGLELSLCRRYYTQAGAGATGIEEAANHVSFGIKFDTPMRTTPTIVVNPTVSWRVAGGDRSNISVSVHGGTTISYSGIWLYLIDNGNGSVAGRPIIDRNATNFIIASAEL